MAADCLFSRGFWPGSSELITGSVANNQIATNRIWALRWGSSALACISGRVVALAVSPDKPKNSEPLWLFELARVLVRLDHVARLPLLSRIRRSR